MSSNQVFPVILCGGSGTRLWPLSRSGFPKQFLVLSGDDSKKSLFQQAIERIHAIANTDIKLDSTLIVTNEEHRFLALDQLREIKSASNHFAATLLLEPSGRNTAPALTLAAFYAQDKGNDPILVVTPADQTVTNPTAFTKALIKSIEIAKEGAIAILGITPSTPETGYGYIKANDEVGHKQGDSFVVERFVEKPNETTAKQYLEEGGYFWNGGMFVLKASVWLAALKEFRPDIFGATETAWVAKSVDHSGDATFVRPDKEIFKTIPSKSIDYAVIEKCPGSKFPIKMVELDAGWNDLGAWDAVWQVGKQDQAGNVTSGDTLLTNSKGSLIHASSRLVSAVGVENLIIVETADAVLVADRKNSQDVKNIVGQLEAQKREEKNLHRKVSRPWGWYDSVDEGERFKVKRIQVKPGASLSLQMHHHRAEHWIVVKGAAEITNGDKVLLLTENQSTYIPQGQTHRLANPGKTTLEIIEVQSGSYLGEDDIVRFEDTYGRS
ncbi:MAG: mannose-1-phosphate guanylyltransferase/mannose-6-phosphate isomerase [Polynucleobacter sp. 24-46-87]|uniref:mannose-1-phosphate guanylyltransferase/mannose-6-phosphate isomerase n=1 Tax=unclassified Polynucleobacter TaxID=2640945 RepID=UPI000BC87FE8|nr:MULTISPECIES: mannose-1-phosphate guanylyltransferase/mannose-6-phosphate isomerase [unclassified Polynucleobacter]OYY21100.1 MAG: mannose-1-phosphate guanylyltransferase/mannose-6-phosphate isomerase [Polynucleobacter sp. 35-46-11]OZA16005.1 MAG: mannose-1-phosphate guanylyltransferase/mannose-6-phosphate isomerase [Polynucleobacter sp. 24-46-87]OZA78291.1 MAG: mannose-1-phosphate guanylyltransferase/mannose-6-phosphate isomerase [Polynucleobacter sp. 39-46-10]